MKPLVVGIAGGSGSGKSTVAQGILRGLDPIRAVHLTHDRYYRDLSQLPVQERARHNFDHPDALETDLLVDHLDRLRAGERVVPPVYDFGTHCRLPGGEALEPAPVILLEGVLILVDPELRRRLDLRIFVDTDADVRLARRLRRDVNERGRSPGSVLRQYEQTVRPMHLAFAEPSRRHAHVILPEGGFNTAGLEMIVGSIRSRVGRG